MSHSEKCSMLVSCRSISVSHTKMPSLAVSNSSLWLIKCCVCEIKTMVYEYTAPKTTHIVLCIKSNNMCTLSLRMMEATLFCRLSHLWLVSWAISLSWQEESVRFSLARRRYCLLISSSWVRLSWTCLWKAYRNIQRQCQKLSNASRRLRFYVWQLKFTT